MIISSDNGLHHFNVTSRTLSTVIKGVEFNRQALYKEGEIIYAGSVNGLYKISVKDLPVLIEQNMAEIRHSSFDDKMKNVLFFISLFFIGFIVVLVSFRSKLTKAKKIIETLQNPPQATTKEKIEQYISANLSTVSIKTLTEHFNTNGPALYEILKPDRPGSLIQQLRLKVVKRMRQDGNSLNEISETSGFSVSYIKKLKG